MLIRSFNASPGQGRNIKKYQRHDVLYSKNFKYIFQNCGDALTDIIKSTKYRLPSYKNIFTKSKNHLQNAEML